MINLKKIGKSDKKRLLEIMFVTLIIVFTIIVRARIMFGTSLIPGMNGAYYLVQTRSIIEKLSLGEHDMPLVFVLQAGLALLVKFFSRLDLNSSIFLAVKIFDCIIPALSAIPAYLIARYIDRGKHSILTVFVSTSVVAFSYGPLRMLGDFQKNSLGMMWFLYMAYFLIKALSSHSKRDLFLSIGFLALTGLTHIGAFGVALVFAVLVALSWIAFVSKLSKRTLMILGFTILGGGGLLALLMIGSDSIRISKLISYISEPLSVFGFSNARGMFRLESSQNSILFGLISIVTAFVLVLKRHSVEKWEYTLIIPSLIMTLFLISPFVSQDLSIRFQIMAFAPGALVLAFLLKHSENMLKQVLAIIILIALVIGIPSTTVAANSPSISEEAYKELTTLNEYVNEPFNTLIIARHGLEWWVAWSLHTDIAQEKAVTSDDWETYEQVLFIQETSRGGSFGSRMPSGQIIQPTDRIPPSPGQTFKPNDRGFQSGQIPQMILPRDQFSNNMNVVSDSEELFSGNYFILYELPSPVSFSNTNR